jgi:hypothetical protein
VIVAENEIIVTNEATSDTSSVSVSNVTEAQALLTELFTELKGFEQSRLASEMDFGVLIRRAIYAINKESPPSASEISATSILPYIDSQGSALERIQFLGTSIEVAIDTIAADPNISSLLDD